MSGTRAIADPLMELLPHAAVDERAPAGELITTMPSAVGKRFSQSERTAADMATHRDAVADILCGYVERCDGRSR